MILLQRRSFQSPGAHGVVIMRLLWLFFATFLTTADAQHLAFPGAKGWAASTPGGRGGRVIRVTNLDAGGEGSFSEAVGAKGKRIIVFEVGGVIDLKGRTLTISEPYVTIEGQTAPSPGITLIDGGIEISTHDVIVQHIRVRTGAARHIEDWEPDALSTASAYNVIVDHCSFTWAVDENCSASGPAFKGETPEEWRKNTSHRITFSNNIIAEGLSHSTHTLGEHSKGTLVHDNVSDILIWGNLYAHNKDRNAYFKGGTRGIFANNYIYNPGKSAIKYALLNDEWEDRPRQTGKLTVIGNVMQLGLSSADIPMLMVDNGPCQVYLEDNIARKRNGEEALVFFGDSAKLVSGKPIWFQNLGLIQAGDVKSHIIRDAGARPWDRDEHDKRIINQMLSLEGEIIDSETEVGGYPGLSSYIGVRAVEEIEAGMMQVRGGSFEMGSDSGFSNERPVHYVTVHDFLIGKYEVTQRQWEAIMGFNPSYFSDCEECPVERVSWNDCQEFIARLNRLSGRTYRLPTEAEWEFAARGGGKSGGFPYAGHSDLFRVAWYIGNNQQQKTHPVGLKEANELGLYDMTGNVWEWCGDWYSKEYYRISPPDNPSGPAGGIHKVLRSCGWGTWGDFCRISNREYENPSVRVSGIGFRLVRVD